MTKAYGDVQVLRGIDLAVQRARGVALIGASGSGKSTLLRCIDLLDEIDDGDVFLDGEVITDPAVRAGAGAPAPGDGLPGVQPVPAHDDPRERHARPPSAPMASTAPRRSERGRELLGALRARGARGRLPRPPLRRPAAARRAGAGARHAAAGAAARRDHERARPRARRRGPEPRARSQGRGNDDADRHARDGLRARGRQRGLLPARRARSSSAASPSRCSPRRSARRRSASCVACSTRGGCSQSSRS